MKASAWLLRSGDEQTDWREMLARGEMEYAEAVKERMGHDTLIVGLVGMPCAHGVDRLGIPEWVKLMYRQPAEVERITEYALRRSMEVSKAVAHVGVDAFYSEDWGNSVDIISPVFFRRFVAPYEKRMVEYLKRFGLPVICRVCGYVKPLLDLILSYGADAYHFEGSMKGLSFEVAEMETAVKERGNACLVAPFDVLHTLREGSPAVVEREVRRVVDTAGAGGGLILGTNVPMMKDVSIASMQAMVQAARKWGKYPRC
ncbi:MAG: uroporphyrinogen decarboxylase family protein [Candidatus Bathyarchaeia archaeon]